MPAIAGIFFLSNEKSQVMSLTFFHLKVMPDSAGIAILKQPYSSRSRIISARSCVLFGMV